jgi:hypothetical protein
MGNINTKLGFSENWYGLTLSASMEQGFFSFLFFQFCDDVAEVAIIHKTI